MKPDPRAVFIPIFPAAVNLPIPFTAPKEMAVVAALIPHWLNYYLWLNYISSPFIDFSTAVPT
jgi:hypothetical protein